MNLDNLVDHLIVGKSGNPSALGAEDRRFESYQSDSLPHSERGKPFKSASETTGCSSAWPEFPAWNRDVVGSNPTALMEVP